MLRSISIPETTENNLTPPNTPPKNNQEGNSYNPTATGITSSLVAHGKFVAPPSTPMPMNRFTHNTCFTPNYSRIITHHDTIKINELLKTKVKNFFATNPTKTKYSKHLKDYSVSFRKINDQYFLILPGRIGIGHYGYVKKVINIDTNEEFALKITGITSEKEITKWNMEKSILQEMPNYYGFIEEQKQTNDCDIPESQDKDVPGQRIPRMITKTRLFQLSAETTNNPKLMDSLPIRPSTKKRLFAEPEEATPGSEAAPSSEIPASLGSTFSNFPRGLALTVGEFPKGFQPNFGEYSKNLTPNLATSSKDLAPNITELLKGFAPNFGEYSKNLTPNLATSSKDLAPPVTQTIVDTTPAKVKPLLETATSCWIKQDNDPENLLSRYHIKPGQSYWIKKHDDPKNLPSKYHIKVGFIMKLFNDAKTMEEYLNTNDNLTIMNKLDLLLMVLHELRILKQKNIIHNDLHLSNILILPNKNSPNQFTIEIIDFGRAKRLPSNYNYNNTDLLILKKSLNRTNFANDHLELTQILEQIDSSYLDKDNLLEELITKCNNLKQELGTTPKLQF